MAIGSITSIETSQLPSKQEETSFFTDLKDWISESVTFAWQFMRHPHTLGTPFVCSPFVAKEITKYVGADESASARHYLEVGAGTGSMTRRLIRKLRPMDRLHVVEINKALYDILQKKYASSQVIVHHNAIQEWNAPAKTKFDVIVSTVPLNSLPSKEVLGDILNTYKSLIKPNGIISSVEYVGTTILSKIVYFGAAKKKFDGILALKNEFFKQYSFTRPIVVLNIPSARVTHCRISS